MIPAPTTLWSTLRLAQDKDPLAWKRLFERYERPIRRFLRHRIRGLSEEDTEDLSQAVFFQISREGFLSRADASKGRFRNLLHAVTLNVVNMWLRGEYARKRKGDGRVVPLDAGLPIDQLCAASPEGNARFDREWAKNVIEQALESLRSESRRTGTPYYQAVHAFFLEERSYREIALSLEIDEQDVGNYVARGKKKLRAAIRAFIRQYASTEEEFEEELRALKDFLPSSM